jgi:F-type H+-transporting ATPase subunit c
MTNFFDGTIRKAWTARNRTIEKNKMTMVTDMIPLLAEAAASAPIFNGNFALGVAGAGAGIGVGLIGMAAASAVGRNPTAMGNILTIAIIGMALAEAIAIYGLIMALRG